jgi:hypothetical protein
MDCRQNRSPWRSSDRCRLRAIIGTLAMSGAMNALLDLLHNLLLRKGCLIVATVTTMKPHGGYPRGLLSVNVQGLDAVARYRAGAAAVRLALRPCRKVAGFCYAPLADFYSAVGTQPSRSLPYRPASRNLKRNSVSNCWTGAPQWF